MNKIVYAITLMLTGANGGKTKVLTRYIEFSTMGATAPTPEKPLTRQDISSAYYYVYNYLSVIDVLNDNLKSAMPDLTSSFDEVESQSDRLDLLVNLKTPFSKLILILARSY